MTTQTINQGFHVSSSFLSNSHAKTGDFKSTAEQTVRKSNNCNYTGKVLTLLFIHSFYTSEKGYSAYLYIYNKHPELILNNLEPHLI